MFDRRWPPIGLALLLMGCATPASTPTSVPTSVPTPIVVTSVTPIASAPATPTVLVLGPSPAPTATAPMVVGSPTSMATLVPTATAVEAPAPFTASYTIVHSYPHDRQAFTEGLIYARGELYESTGLNGQSSLRRVELATGKVLQQISLTNEYFGEGVTLFGDRLYQLTWKTQIGFVYERATFKEVARFAYPMEGWGITHDGTQLILSDGTSTLHFYDPNTLSETHRIEVTLFGQPLRMLNELEYVRGEVYANIWLTNLIARIDPKTGVVLGLIDLSGLLSADDLRVPVDELNGIAYDPETDRLFVTGKHWPKLFEIRVR